jgi:hypothetical protein
VSQALSTSSPGKAIFLTALIMAYFLNVKPERAQTSYPFFTIITLTDNGKVASIKAEEGLQILPKGEQEIQNSKQIVISAMTFKTQKVTCKIKFNAKFMFLFQ